MTDAALPLFTLSSGDLRLSAHAGRGSGTLVVVFSQVRVPDGHFGLSRLFAATRHACLFVNQPDNRWYRDSTEAVDAAVHRARRATGAGRLVFYGSSMGAFGALAAAARHPDSDVVAYAPDWRIGEAGSRSAEAGLAAIDGEPDLAALIAARPPERRTDVVVGILDGYDAGVVARLAQGPRPAVPVWSAHEVHDHLYTVNVVRRIIGTFDRPARAAVAERDLLAETVPPHRLAAYSRLALALAAGAAVAPDDVAALDLAGHLGAEVLQADSLAAAGRIAEAQAALAAIDASLDHDRRRASLPKRFRKTIVMRRITLAERHGARELAAALSAEAARRYPSDRRFSRS